MTQKEQIAQLEQHVEALGHKVHELEEMVSNQLTLQRQLNDDYSQMFQEQQHYWEIAQRQQKQFDELLHTFGDRLNIWVGITHFMRRLVGPFRR